MSRPTRTPQHVIEQAVRRHMQDNEPVSTLMKEYKVSKAGFYNWVAAYKTRILEQSRRAGMTPKDIDKSDKLNLMAELEAIKLENQKLRNRLVSILIKYGTSDLTKL